MWRLIDMGYQLIDTATQVSGFLAQQIPDSIITAVKIISFNSITLPSNTTFASLLFGYVLCIILLIRLLKFVTS